VAIVSGLLFGAGASAGSTTLFGDAIAFAGTLGWVWYTRGATRFPGLDVIEYTALTVLASWPVLLAAAIGAAVLGWSAVPSLEGLRLSWQALFFVGVVPSAISVLAFNYGVRTLGAVTGTAFINFVPVSALLMSAALGRLPTVNEAVGMAMVVGALLIHTALSRKASAPAPAPIAKTPQNSRNYSTCGAASS
jgi:drug/metabolite transporter (DMT)-like permease